MAPAADAEYDTIEKQQGVPLGTGHVPEFMEIDRGQDGGGKQEHDAFAAPAHLDLFLLAGWMSGGNGEVHESSRHQKINQRGDEQQALIPQMTPAARITGFDLRRWVNSSAITTRYAMKNTSSAV